MAKRTRRQDDDEPMAGRARYYAVCKMTPALWAVYRDATPEGVHDYITEHLPSLPSLSPRFDIVARPSNNVGRLGSDEAHPLVDDPPSALVTALEIDHAVVDEFHIAVNRNKKVFLGGGADLPFATAEHWCPRDATDPIFADRSAAERLLGVPYLRDQKKCTGKDVNVVIVDKGLDKNALGNSYGDGWPVAGTQPGKTDPEPGSTRRTHGMMIAHNVLKVAPKAKLFDLPLITTARLFDIPVFLSLAEAAFRTMIADIRQFGQPGGRFPGRWILVNPWGIFDRKSEFPRGSYTDNPHNTFNVMVRDAAVNDGIDVVFAAGNCGQFCPDGRCGANDYGPGRSIFGANCLEAVLTVGAVRADAMWLGYSSQGPGQPRLFHDKPDLCAPSQFCEDYDAHSVNTGTSAACAMAAGVVAGLRSKPGAAALSPAELKAKLISKARRTDGPRWDGRLGHGILDAEAAYGVIP